MANSRLGGVKDLQLGTRKQKELSIVKTLAFMFCGCPKMFLSKKKTNFFTLVNIYNLTSLLAQFVVPLSVPRVLGSINLDLRMH